MVRQGMFGSRGGGTGMSASSRAGGATWPVLGRFAGAIVAGYVFTFGFVGLATLAGFALGLRYFVAETLAWLACFFVYLAAMLWAFTERSLARVWLVLGGGGLALCGSAWLLSRQLL